MAQMCYMPGNGPSSLGKPKLIADFKPGEPFNTLQSPSFRSPPTAITIGGMRKRPVQVDTSWLRTWLDTCESQHKLTCPLTEHQASMPTSIIRFIQVNTRRIVTLRNLDIATLRFLALSYPWGDRHRVTLKSDNLLRLSQEGEVRDVSQTVEDAIALTADLGIDLLWCDALCIMQDNDKDKAEGIASMAAIYHAATAVIVEASGEHAEAGLAGMRASSRRTGQEERVIAPATASSSKDGCPGISLFHSPGIPEHSPWTKRGWTLQEGFNARRLLIFTSEMVLWECHERSWREDFYLENFNMRVDVSLPEYRSASLQKLLLAQTEPNTIYSPEIQREDRFYTALESFISAISGRAFTYEGDIHDGCAAILQVVAQHTKRPLDDFPWGIPRSRFETCLLWDLFTAPSGGPRSLRRRTAFSTLPMTPHRVRVPFPSWSWMAWYGRVSMSTWHYGKRDGAEILCYSHATSPLRISRVRSKDEPHHYSRQIDEYLFDPTRPYKSPGPDDATDVWRPMDQPLTVSLADLETHHPQLAKRLNSIPDSLLIFFWASTAVLDLWGRQILNHDGEVIGETKWNEDPSDVEAGSGLDPDSHPLALPPLVLTHNDLWMRKAEFVVIGRWQWKHVPYTMKTFQIRWHEGIAYKVNHADIEERDWVKLKTEWKLVPLG
ncbi:HET-domain-containing protein [Thozetella sp. PMI_491]|nr:HET-domain-containing protein [Thozetella sp. PMI_491]